MFFLKKIKKLQKKSRPSREFRKSLLINLNNQINMNHSKKVWRLIPATLIALIIVFSFGASAYAYNSNEVIEGHPLFFLKHNIEKMEGRLAVGSEAKVNFHHRMMERRLKEANHFGENNEKMKVLLEKAANELDLSVEELRNQIKDPKTRVEIMNRLADQGFEYAEACQKHNEQFGQKRLNIGQHIMNQEECNQEGCEMNLHQEKREEIMKKHQENLGSELSLEIQFLHQEIFDQENLNMQEKHQQFRTKMKDLIKNKIEVKKADK